MKPLFAAVAVFFLSNPAHAARIDCVKAHTPIENAICGDLEMTGLDARIGLAYSNAVSAQPQVAPWVRANQRRWLLERNAISSGFDENEIEAVCQLSDKPCIRAFLRRRAEELEARAYRHAGVWKAANGAKLIISAISGQRFNWTLYRRGSDPIRTLDDDSGQHWTPQGVMAATMGDGSGFPQKRVCEITVTASAKTAKIAQKGVCLGFDYSGRYARDLTDDPMDYETGID